MLKTSSSKKLVVIGKWSILFVATGYLIIYSDSINFTSLHQSIAIHLFIGCMLISFLNRAFNAYRLVQIVDIVESNNHLSTFTSLRILLFSEFVSVVIPTTYSAELVRTVKLSQYNLSLKKSAIAILLDRGIGLFFLCAGTFVALLLSDFKLANLIGAKNIETIYLVILISLVFLLVIFYRFNGVFDKLTSVSKRFLDVKKSLRILFVSFLSFGTGAVSYYLAFLTASVEISFIKVVFIVFISFIARLVPFSVLGISAGEVALVIVSEKFGVGHELAVITAVIIVLSRYLFAVMGVLVEIYIDGVSVVTGHLRKAVKNI